MCYEFIITYFVLALQRIVRKLHHVSVFSRTLLCTIFFYYAYELNDNGRSAQYQPKSFIMTDS